jgi:hypothetical protein
MVGSKRSSTNYSNSAELGQVKVPIFTMDSFLLKVVFCVNGSLPAHDNVLVLYGSQQR